MDAEALIKDILTRESAKMDTSALFSFKGHPAVHVATNGDDLHKMKAWVDSLSTKELLRALDFTFCRDDSDAAAENGVVSSHEYELLKQMLAMQSSPPTPIHPRALLYKPATIRGATDGRDEEDRVLKNRLHAPRFFQFLEKNLVSTALNTTGSRDHVPEVERQIQVIKERMQAHHTNLPFPSFTIIMTI